jgi:hypothetical protein
VLLVGPFNDESIAGEGALSRSAKSGRVAFV